MPDGGQSSSYSSKKKLTISSTKQRVRTGMIKCSIVCGENVFISVGVQASTAVL